MTNGFEPVLEFMNCTGGPIIICSTILLPHHIISEVIFEVTVICHTVTETITAPPVEKKNMLLYKSRRGRPH